MRYIKLFEDYSDQNTNNKFYHFSELVLEEGDILRSNICDNQMYLDIVMPIYKEVAKENGFEWPVCHGYCFTDPKFILTGYIKDPNNYKEIDMKNSICYEIEADADFHIGAIDRSSQYITMLLDKGLISEGSIREYAKQYFMTPPTTYKEAICSKFRVVRALDRSEWSVEKVS